MKKNIYDEINRPMLHKCLVNIDDYSRDDIFRILESTARFKERPDRDLLQGKVCATLSLNLPHAPA